MRKWSVIVLIEPDQSVEEVEVEAHSERDAKPKAVHKLMKGKYRNRGCRMTVAQVDEISN